VVFKINWSTIQSFTLLVISALGFSIGIVLVRFFSDINSLSGLLNYQSKVVLLSFFLQLGLRTLIRKYQHLGYSYIVKNLLGMLISILLIISFLAGGLSFFSVEKSLIGSSCLLGYLTCQQSLSVSSGNLKLQFITALIILTYCLAPSVLILSGIINFENVIDVLSVALLIIVFLRNHIAREGLWLRRWKLLLFLCFRAHYYQLSVGVVLFIIYVFTQVTLNVYDGENEIVAFADSQIMSGALVLVAGKVLLLVEKKIYKVEEIRNKVMLLSMFSQLILCLLMAIPIYLISSVSYFFCFVALFILSSRFCMGYILVYMDEYKREFVPLSVLLFVAIAIGYYQNIFCVKGIYYLQVIPVLVLYGYAFLALYRLGIFKRNTFHV